MRIAREFNNPEIVKALACVAESTLSEILDNAEILEALEKAKKQNDPIRPAGDFFAELKKDELI
jgi:hypothetical protein